nr:MAG TPA: hypothetical protein [Caudoviricetes sp.]
MNLKIMEMMLKMQNPEGYKQYINFKNSGKSPDQVIDELMRTGQINNDMLNKARNMAANGDIPGNSSGYMGPKF